MHDFPMLPLAWFSMPGGMEWLIIGGIGLLFFGKRLPEVGRSIGLGIVEFKRGLKGIGDSIEEESDKPGKTALPKTAQEPEAKKIEASPTPTPSNAESA